MDGRLWWKARRRTANSHWWRGNDSTVVVAAADTVLVVVVVVLVAMAVVVAAAEAAADAPLIVEAPNGMKAQREGGGSCLVFWRKVQESKGVQRKVACKRDTDKQACRNSLGTRRT